MDPTPFIIGAASLAFLLLYFAFNLDKEHTILKLMCVLAVFIIFILIPKATLDTPPYCETVLASQNITETQITPSLKTDYIENTYDQYCLPAKTTNLSLYRIMLWLFRLIFVYILLYIIYLVFQKSINNFVSQFKSGRGKRP